MKNLIGLFGIIFLLFQLTGCGDNKGKNVCVSQASKILECRAVESARNYFNTEIMLEQQKAKCEREYPVQKCYD